jgi:hypothetical protein
LSAVFVFDAVVTANYLLIQEADSLHPASGSPAFSFCAWRPPHVVFSAWTKPELLKRWWAP